MYEIYCMSNPKTTDGSNPGGNAVTGQLHINYMQCK